MTHPQPMLCERSDVECSPKPVVIEYAPMADDGPPPQIDRQGSLTFEGLSPLPDPKNDFSNGQLLEAPLCMEEALPSQQLGLMYSQSPSKLLKNKSYLLDEFDCDEQLLLKTVLKDHVDHGDQEAAEIDRLRSRSSSLVRSTAETETGSVSDAEEFPTATEVSTSIEDARQSETDKEQEEEEEEEEMETGSTISTPRQVELPSTSQTPHPSVASSPTHQDSPHSIEPAEPEPDADADADAEVDDDDADADYGRGYEVVPRTRGGGRVREKFHQRLSTLAEAQPSIFSEIVDADELDRVFDKVRDSPNPGSRCREDLHVFRVHNRQAVLSYFGLKNFNSFTKNCRNWNIFAVPETKSADHYIFDKDFKPCYRAPNRSRQRRRMLRDDDEVRMRYQPY